MKILVAADGSDYTRRMLAYIAAHDEWLGVNHRYTVFYAIPAVPHRAAALAAPDVIHALYEEDADAVFAPIRKFFALQKIQAEFAHEIGAPASHIAGLASSGKFDLLMMGSRGHGAIETLVLGSVVTRVLALCTVPILIVR
jgi:nucleotide-binding universal stress UspA family protein